MNHRLLQEAAGNLSTRQREILGAAIQADEELAATIDELLDLTRIEAGQLRIAHDWVDLAQVVDQCVQTLQPRYEDGHVAVKVVKDVPAAIIQGDAMRLRLVFINLLSNALKYTPAGGGVVVRLASMQNAAAASAPILRITVTDSGQGIPADLRERVFEKFFRVEDERPNGSQGVRGTGIGLYVCREIIKAHGGSIHCNASENGSGTQIAIDLPADQNA
jgi:NtrC-family two-component system sensor histidine kinase KinB